MRRRLGTIAGLLFILFGLLLVHGRNTLLGIPYAPNRKASSWKIELEISALATGRPARLSVFNPSVRNFFQIQNRAFSSEGYGISTTRINNRSTVDFSRRDPGIGKQHFSIRFEVEEFPERPIREFNSSMLRKFSDEQLEALSALRNRLSESGNGARNTRAVVREILEANSPELAFLSDKSDRIDALNSLGIASRLYYGFRLEEGAYVEKLSPYLLIQTPEKELIYSISSRAFRPRSGVFLWGSSKNPLRETAGFSDIAWKLVALPIQARVPEATLKTRGFAADTLRWFSLDRLSLSSQRSFGMLLLLPLAGLVVVFLRNIIGLRTFGTFMPAIIALSFRDTGLTVGLTLFFLVVIAGLILRILFKYFRLLFVPRIAATLTCVVIILFTLSLLGVDFEVPAMASLTLFPVVILAMVIERLSVAIEEYGYVAALNLLAMSLLAATLSYLVISERSVTYLFSAFPELNFIVLGLAILIGRYFGYRAAELFRFRAFSEQETAL